MFVLVTDTRNRGSATERSCTSGRANRPLRDFDRKGPHGAPQSCEGRVGIFQMQKSTNPTMVHACQRHTFIESTGGNISEMVSAMHS